MISCNRINGNFSNELYKNQTVKELQQEDALAPSFEVTFSSSPFLIPFQIIKKIFYTLNPIRWLTLPGGWLISKRQATRFRTGLFPHQNFLQKLWQGSPIIRRFTIRVEGKNIDVCFSGTKSSLKSRKWVLCAMPNAACYEAMLRPDGAVMELGRGLNATVIGFNYPGVAASQGLSDPYTMEKAYKAVMVVLEKELGAKGIVHYGLSMGGGVQALALRDWTSECWHICIKDRTYRSLSRAASSIAMFIGGGVVWIGGWNIDTASCSKRLTHPEIILQAGDVQARSWTPVVEGLRPSLIKSDGVISDQAALASPFCDQPRPNQHFYLANVRHNDSVSMKPIIKKVQSLEPRKKMVFILIPCENS